MAVLTQAYFHTGIKLKIGLPPGKSPKDHPVVDLAQGARAVKFNVYFSEVLIVQNSPASFGPGQWHTFTQTIKDPWSVSMSVNLTVEDLDMELSQSKYLSDRPYERDRLIEKLKGLTDRKMTFSLQQLLFDLDNAALQDAHNFEGLPSDSTAALTFTQYVLKTYKDIAKEHGAPLVSIAAYPSDNGEEYV